MKVDAFIGCCLVEKVLTCGLYLFQVRVVERLGAVGAIIIGRLLAAFQSFCYDYNPVCLAYCLLAYISRISCTLH